MVADRGIVFPAGGDLEVWFGADVGLVLMALPLVSSSFFRGKSDCVHMLTAMRRLCGAVLKGEGGGEVLFRSVWIWTTSLLFLVDCCWRGSWLLFQALRRLALRRQR